MNYGTLPSRFLSAIDAHPNSRAQMLRHADSTWESIASAELLRRVAGLSMALVELGVKPGDRVGLFAANRPSGTPPISPSTVPAGSRSPFISTNRRTA